MPDALYNLNSPSYNSSKLSFYPLISAPFTSFITLSISWLTPVPHPRTDISVVMAMPTTGAIVGTQG